MLKASFRVVGSAVTVAAVSAVVGCGSPSTNASAGPPGGSTVAVVATTPEVADFVRNVGGDAVRLTQMLIELVVVTVMPAAGMILAVALMVAPAAAARPWSDRLRTVYALAVGFGVTSGLVGLALSAAYDVAAGASISLTASALLLLSLAAARIRDRFRAPRPAG